MSDIRLNLDGVIAFFVAAGLGLILLLALISCSIHALVKARAVRGKFIDQPVIPHLVGMAASLAACVVVILLVLAGELGPGPSMLQRRLDDWCLLWAAMISALWPASASLWKHGQKSKMNNEDKTLQGH